MISCVLNKLSLEESLIGDCVSEMMEGHDILEAHEIFIKDIGKGSSFVDLIDHEQLGLEQIKVVFLVFERL